MESEPENVTRPKVVFMKGWELDREFGIKDDFLRALSERYNVVPLGIGENLWVRSEIEHALLQHRRDGKPTLKEMQRLNRQRQREANSNAARTVTRRTA